MAEKESDYSGQQFFADINTRIRDLEEKHRILKDRILLLGESVVKEKERTFSEMQEMKGKVIKLEEDNKRMKELLMRVGEQLNKSARKEDLMILQRQFNLFRSA